MKALKKVLVIIYCVSFIGMTVSPSSAVPCCCKSGFSPSPYDVPALEPTSPPIQSCCSAKKVEAVPSCCAASAPLEKPCNLTRTVNLDCGHCSCLKHLQLVGISENLTNDRLCKATAELPTTTDTVTLPRSEHPMVLIASVLSPPDQTFILHCCLRF